MATILVRNKREHDIELNIVDDKNNLHRLAIPASRRDPEADANDPDALVPGQLEVEEGLLAYARKKYPSIEGYFSEKYLVVLKKKAASSSANDNPPADPPAVPPVPPAE